MKLFLVVCAWYLNLILRVFSLWSTIDPILNIEGFSSLSFHLLTYLKCQELLIRTDSRKPLTLVSAVKVLVFWDNEIAETKRKTVLCGFSQQVER